MPSGPPRIIVTSFSGIDPAVGHELGQRLEDELRKFEDEHVGGGAPRLFQLARVTDVVRNHEAARSCAERLGADLVLWGTVERNPDIVVGDVRTNVRVGPVTTGSGSSISIGNVVLGGKPFTFLPSITLRHKEHWILSSSRLDLFSLADIDFDAIGSDRSLFLIPFLAGAAAFERADLPGAGQMFERASRGEVSATGLAKVYAATYLGTIQLWVGDPSRAVRTLDVPTSDLAACPNLLVWQNRMLLGRAAEQAGVLKRALDAFVAAEVVSDRVEPGRDGIGEGRDALRISLAPLAQIWLMLHLGDGATALSKIDQQLSRIDQLRGRGGSEHERLFLHTRLLALKFYALGILGDRVAARECFYAQRLNVQQLLGFRGMSMALEMLALESDLRSPDKLPSVWEIAQDQFAGCGAVHWTWSFPDELAESTDLSRLVGDFDEMENGQGRYGQLLAHLPPRARGVFANNIACWYAITAYNGGKLAIAHELLVRAERSLVVPTGLDRAEIQLLYALLEIGARKPVQAKVRIRAQLPVLRDAMGADAPSVLVWERYLTTGRITPNHPSIPSFRRCRK